MAAFALTAVPFSQVPSAYADATVTDYDSLKTAVEQAGTTPTTITVGKDFTWPARSGDTATTLEIPKGANITLTGDSSITMTAEAVTAYPYGEHGVIEVDEGAALTLAGNLKLKGDDSTKVSTARIKSAGTLTFKDNVEVSGFRTQFSNYDENDAPILVTGGQANFAGGTFADNETSVVRLGSNDYNFGAGVLSVTGGTVTVSAATFRSNATTSSGGAIMVNGDNATLNITGGTFTGNKAAAEISSSEASLHAGGAVYGRKGVIAVSGGTFSDNTVGNDKLVNSDNFRNGTIVAGGAIMATQSLKVTGGTFTDNKVSSVQKPGNNDLIEYKNVHGAYGGAIAVLPSNPQDAKDYQNAFTSYTGVLSITGGTFSGNTAASAFARGGAVYAGAKQVTLTGASFMGNTASGPARSTSGDSGEPDVSGSYGGGVYVRKDIPEKVVLGNLKLSDNKASDGADLFLSNVETYQDWENTTKITKKWDSTVETAKRKPVTIELKAGDYSLGSYTLSDDNASGDDVWENDVNAFNPNRLVDANGGKLAFSAEELDAEKNDYEPEYQVTTAPEDGAAEVTVTNRKLDATADATISGSVVLHNGITGQDDTLKKGQFHYELLDEADRDNPVVVATGENAADGTIKLVAKKLKPGTYTYTLIQKDEGAKGVLYDTVSYKVMVTVSAPADGGKATAQVSVEGGKKIAFKNTYTGKTNGYYWANRKNIKVNKASDESVLQYVDKPEPIFAENGDRGARPRLTNGSFRGFLLINKAGKDLNAGGKTVQVAISLSSEDTRLRFETGDKGLVNEDETITVAGTDRIPRPRLVDAKGNVTWPIYEVKDGKLIVTVPDDQQYSLWYAWTMLDGRMSNAWNDPDYGPYLYDVKQDAQIVDVQNASAEREDEWGYWADAAQQFPNTPVANGYATLSVVKTVNGQAPADDQEFEFELSAVGDGPTPMPEDGVTKVTTKGAAVASFGKIHYGYEDAGLTYTYKISEKTKLGDGWVKAPDVTVTVKVGYFGNPKWSILGDPTITYSSANADGTAALFNNAFTENKHDLYVNKYVAGTTQFLPGAELELRDASGKVVESWTSTDKTHKIAAQLEAGKKYTLVETKAPDGYHPADPVTFTFEEGAEDQTVDMEDTPTHVEFSKLDKDGQPVKGAKLQVRDASGKVVEEWTTDGTVHTVVAKLVAGATYTLHEAEAPAGYQAAKDVAFTVPQQAEKLKVSMTDLKQETPDTPEKPEKPGKPGKPTLPRTGDDTLASVLGVVLIGVAAIGAGVVARRRQR